MIYDWNELSEIRLHSLRYADDAEYVDWIMWLMRAPDVFFAAGTYSHDCQAETKRRRELES